VAWTLLTRFRRRTAHGAAVSSVHGAAVSACTARLCPACTGHGWARVPARRAPAPASS